MTETKSWQIPAKRENEFLKTWPCFGWTIKSNSDFKTDLGSKGVKITCTRDTDMPNYSRLRELGETYEKIFLSEPLPLMPFVAVMLTLCWILPGAIYICVTKCKRKKWNEKMKKLANPALAEAKQLL